VRGSGGRAANEAKGPPERAFRRKRMKGLEPSTFCMASSRASPTFYLHMGGVRPSFAMILLPLGGAQGSLLGPNLPCESTLRGSGVSDLGLAPDPLLKLADGHELHAPLMTSEMFGWT
jgi:hypothetical protein